MVIRRSLTTHIGSGTVWLARDPRTNDYSCSWRDDAGGQLLEESRAPSEKAAVDWGRARTPQVIFQDGTDRFWAGIGTAPKGIAGHWSEDVS